MKISILLPYKENFSPIYPGAVSLFVKDTTNISKFKNSITIYGNTNLKKIYKLNYKNIFLKKNIIQSGSKIYVNEFLKYEKKNPSNVIEIHNRPNYFHLIFNSLKTITDSLEILLLPVTSILFIICENKNVVRREYKMNDFKIILNIKT